MCITGVLVKVVCFHLQAWRRACVLENKSAFSNSSGNVIKDVETELVGMVSFTVNDTKVLKTTG